jgi:hypothetical protein
MASFLKRVANASFVPGLLSMGPSCRPAFTEVFAVAIEMPRADNARLGNYGDHVPATTYGATGKYGGKTCRDAFRKRDALHGRWLADGD